LPQDPVNLLVVGRGAFGAKDRFVEFETVNHV
jgi:hypothetical protein